MVKCSQHVIPPAVQVDLTDRQAHVLGVELDAPRASVLTCRWLGIILARQASEVIDPH
jgi:hypothetical protein